MKNIISFAIWFSIGFTVILIGNVVTGGYNTMLETVSGAIGLTPITGFILEMLKDY